MLADRPSSATCGSGGDKLPEMKEQA